MKTAIITVVIAITLLGASSLAEADIFELPLAAEGEYDFNSPYWTADFDLSVTFTDISNVYIDWAGEITAALVIFDDNPGMDPAPFGVGIVAAIGTPPNWRHTGVVSGGGAAYPEPEPFDLRSEFEFGTMPWSELFDGQGTIGIEYTEPIIFGTYVEHGSVVLNSATLIVDGVPVPEPATFLFMTIGAIALRAKHRNKSPEDKHK